MILDLRRLGDPAYLASVYPRRRDLSSRARADLDRAIVNSLCAFSDALEERADAERAA